MARRSREPSRSFGFVKEPGKAKRWRNETNPDYARGATISDRKMSDLSRERRTGEKTTKEQYQKGILSGRYRFDNATAERQANAVHGRAIKREISEIAPRDARLITKIRKNSGPVYDRDQGYEALSDKEKERFHELYEIYPSDSVRQLLGSPKTKKGGASKRVTTRRERRTRFY